MGGKSENDEATSAEVEYNVNKRPSRSTAGNRYAKLLQGELEKMKDDFYQETYGGFNEEDNDNDFDGDTMEDDDVLDSDFNTSDEAEGDDEGAGGGDSDGEVEGRKKRKTKRVLTRAYKEPKRAKDGTQVRKGKPRVEAVEGNQVDQNSEIISSDMQLRRSTKDRRELLSSKHATTKTGAHRSRRAVQYMSQEERLREAEKMEVINKESLEKFLKLEEEKKEKRQVKKVDKGPQITFKSFTTTSSSATFGADPNSMHEYTDFSIRSLTSPGFGDLQTDSRGDTKTSKNVIIFPDEKSLKENFPKPHVQETNQRQASNTSRMICPITRQPAKYFDPLTQQPYSSMSAFKVLRQIYKLKLSILHSTGAS
ncbi:vacuolar protein sorting-associated protein 72 homolog [Convolutriloba macropyga]|uniref:vacuolar protein sorting-associated protein 72 homolog n=1 Tax=Convolutriloba macropyga TaxID=536237 RepID=UPI003F51C35F